MDQPATPVEKYYAMRTHYIATGKQFDENVIKRGINQAHMELTGTTTPPLDLSHNPESIPESETRARNVRMDDREATAEVEAAQNLAKEHIAAASSLQASARVLEERNRQLEAQVAELMAQRGDVPQPPPAAPGVPSADGPTIEGQPNANWTRTQVVEWARQNDVPLPKGWNTMTRDDVLNEVLGAATTKAEAATN